MASKYNNAQIYITRCNHPEYSDLKYIGLDTKKDPDYLGSSVVLKWWINFIGRSYFYKDVLDKVTGDMNECCKVEQRYMIEHNAVKDSNYLNMNGGTPHMGKDDSQLDMEYLVLSESREMGQLLSGIKHKVMYEIVFLDQSRIQLINSIINLLTLGYLKYGQEDFEYNKYRNYGSCTPQDMQSVLSCLVRLGYIDTTYELITITPKLVELIPLDVDYYDFETTFREN